MYCKNCNTYNSVGVSNCINCGVFLNAKYKVKKTKPIELNVEVIAEEKKEEENTFVNYENVDLQAVLSFIENDAISSEKSNFQDKVFNLINKKIEKKKKQKKIVDDSSMLSYEPIKSLPMRNDHSIQFDSIETDVVSLDIEKVEEEVKVADSVDVQLNEKVEPQIVKESFIIRLKNKFLSIFKKPSKTN